MKVLTPGHKYKVKNPLGGTHIVEFAERIEVSGELAGVKSGITDAELIEVVLDRAEYISKKLEGSEEDVLNVFENWVKKDKASVAINVGVTRSYFSRALTMYQHMASVLLKKRAEMVKKHELEGTGKA